jgi:hypothetical protein
MDLTDKTDEQLVTAAKTHWLGNYDREDAAVDELLRRLSEARKDVERLSELLRGHEEEFGPIRNFGDAARRES